MLDFDTVMDEPVTPFVSLQTAASLTGVSVRTLWRRIADGQLRTCKEDSPSGRTLVALDDLRPITRLPLGEGDFGMLSAADKCDPDAQCELGLAFLLAGMAEEAFGWFSLSAERFCPDALHQLARCYLTGGGCPRDEALGIQLMARAADRGHVVAAHLLKYLDDPVRLILAAEALESELDSIERRLVLEVLQGTVAVERS